MFRPALPAVKHGTVQQKIGGEKNVAVSWSVHNSSDRVKTMKYAALDDDQVRAWLVETDSSCLMSRLERARIYASMTTS